MIWSALSASGMPRVGECLLVVEVLCVFCPRLAFSPPCPLPRYPSVPRVLPKPHIPMLVDFSCVGSGKTACELY